MFTRYVKVTFFNGAALRPLPPGGTEKSKEARWIDIYESDALDEALMRGMDQAVSGAAGLGDLVWGQFT